MKTITQEQAEAIIGMIIVESVLQGFTTHDDIMWFMNTDEFKLKLEALRKQLNF